MKEDAFSRDLVLNTLQYDPIENVRIDATGKALDALANKEISFNMPDILQWFPRYVFRAFKFLERGYNISTSTAKILQSSLHYTANEAPKQVHGFLKRQIGMKDGRAGLLRFKAEWMKYDPSGNIWRQVVESHFNTVLREFP